MTCEDEMKWVLSYFRSQNIKQVLRNELHGFLPFSRFWAITNQKFVQEYLFFGRKNADFDMIVLNIKFRRLSQLSIGVNNVTVKHTVR